jgi:transposase
MLQEFSLHQPQVFKIIFLDRASYHRSKTLQVPGNTRLVYLPAANPELNPVERLWQDLER